MMDERQGNPAVLVDTISVSEQKNRLAEMLTRKSGIGRSRPVLKRIQ